MDSTTFGGLSFVVAACRLLSGRADEVYSIDIYDAVRDAAPSVSAGADRGDMPPTPPFTSTGIIDLQSFSFFSYKISKHPSLFTLHSFISFS